MTPRVSVPSPCPAQWDQMTPAPGGRHCTACNKVVVDFTGLSEAEVLAYLQQHPEACGRFQPTHVKALPLWAPWLAAAVVALSGCEAEPIDNQNTDLIHSKVSSNHFFVQGTVVDKETSEPIAHALVISEQDTTYHVRTAADGSFQLQLPLRLLGTRLVAAIEPERTRDNRYEGRFYTPKYFTANQGAAVRVRLRNPGLVIGSPALATDECFSAAVMPYIGPQAPPPPPPKLSTIKFIPPTAPPQNQGE